MTDTQSAALFDIDGTLVDSNYLHIESWSRAFADLGIDVDDWRIHRSIGMDSGKLLDALIPAEVEEHGEKAKELHASHYGELTDRLRPFAGARELVRELDRRGVRVVLATSAPANELEILRKVLDVDGALSGTTSSEDVGTAKPEPDIVAVALEKAQVDAAAAAFIGDAVWDFVAARKLGLVCVGVLSGGYSATELLEAGAEEVYDDVADLLEHLDDSPLTALWA